MSKERFQQIKQLFTRFVRDDQRRIYIQLGALYGILFLTCIGAGIANLASGGISAGTAILLFAFACFLDLVLHLINGVFYRIGAWLFVSEVIGFFTYFLIVGSPGNAATIWMVLIPCFGLLLFRKKMGSIFVGVMFAILAFFSWIPFGVSLLQYEYDPGFIQRFPFLYIVCFFLAFLFESIREHTYKELKLAREKYEYLYDHDALTGLYSRSGFQKRFQWDEPNGVGPVALAMVDIDYFKGINDYFGHLNGDAVLKQIAGIFLKTIGESGTVCRWGGEEFLLCISNVDEAVGLCEKTRLAVHDSLIELNGQECRVNISIGLTMVPKGQPFNRVGLVQQADECLYQAKESGRNRVVSSFYKDLQKQE